MVQEASVASRHHYLPGLLSNAHEQGLGRVETYVGQMPSRKNGITAIYTTVVTTEMGVYPISQSAYRGSCMHCEDNLPLTVLDSCRVNSRLLPRRN